VSVEPSPPREPTRHLHVADLRHPAQVKTWFDGSAPGHMWRRLDEIDFVTRGMSFAAVLLLSFVPFILVLQQVRGRAGATALIRRFGLDPAAASALQEALTSPRSPSSTLSGLSWVFMVLGGISGATAIQQLYEKAFGLRSRGRRDMHRQFAWLAAVVVASSLANAVQPWLADVGGIALFAVASLLGGTAFWWFTMWLLLGGRLGWRDLFPAALATGVCWFAMTVAFRLRMSDTITQNYERYGAIGVVFALMSFLVAVGAVLILGAVFGVVWRERRPPKP
jgi:membrane protein